MLLPIAVAILAHWSPADDDAAFESLLASAQAHPENADFTALRFAFSKTTAYSPEGPGAFDTAPVVQEIKNGERAAALVALDRVLDGRWTDPRAHELAAAACERLGETERMRMHDDFADGLMGSILDGGDGRSLATAWPVTCDLEERLVIDAMGLRGGTRTVAEADGHVYHVYQFPTAGGSVRLHFQADVAAAWRKAHARAPRGESRP